MTKFYTAVKPIDGLLKPSGHRHGTDYATLISTTKGINLDFKNSHSELGIKNILTQNSKMKASSRLVYNWTIPAFLSKTGFKTCPQAGVCATGCYARSGAYLWSNVSKVHEAKLELSHRPDFATIMIEAITKVYQPGKELYIRIHDAGDFYGIEYAIKWFKIMEFFKMNPAIQFYAYTKQIEMFQGISKPENFTLIYSFGGKQDHLIKPTDRHSAVFPNKADLLAAGYIDASKDDMMALTDNHRVGLVYHGVKSYTNTKWKKVEVAS